MCRLQHSVARPRARLRQQRFYDVCKLLATFHSKQFGGTEIPDPNVQAKCASWFENPHNIFKVGNPTRTQFSKNVHGWFVTCRAKILKGDDRVWPRIQAEILKIGIGEVAIVKSA